MMIGQASNSLNSIYRQKDSCNQEVTMHSSDQKMNLSPFSITLRLKYLQKWHVAVKRNDIVSGD